MSLVKVFNSQFMEFLKDVQIVLPTDLNIKTAKYYTEKLIKMNPSLLVKSWYELVFIPYKSEIERGDFDFFLNKEYSSDLETIDNNDGILETIKTIKSRVKDLTDDDKQKIIKYTQNLTKISLMYKAKH